MKMKKLTALTITLIMVMGAIGFSNTDEIQAAMPLQNDMTIGKPYDGVDFDALTSTGNAVYYGAYKHLIDAAWDSSSMGYIDLDYEMNSSPILWNTLGEELNDDKITFLSKYAIDIKPFISFMSGEDYETSDEIINSWELSELRAFLNNGNTEAQAKKVVPSINKYENYSSSKLESMDYSDSGFLNSFLNSEENAMHITDVKTCEIDLRKLYLNCIFCNIDSLVTTRDKVYIPWGISQAYSELFPTGSPNEKTENHDTIWWTADNGLSNELSGDDKFSDKSTIAGNVNYQLDDNDRTTVLKNGTEKFLWWMRSPFLQLSEGNMRNHNAINYASKDGMVGFSNVNNTLGVRPAFKLNPLSIIFSSEVLTDTTNKPYATKVDAKYAAAASGAKNFKLTIVDSSLTAGTVTIDGDAVSSSKHPTENLVPGGSVAVAASGSSANLTYKIVGTNTSGVREIVGYGQGDDTDLTITAQNLDGANLEEGEYTVYVWAQANEKKNSHRGSQPLYFNMKINNTSPTVSSIKPKNSATNVTINGEIVINFNKAIGTTGTVSLDGGTTTLTGGSWNNPINKIYTIPYENLAWDTTYTITIEGFEDLANNAMLKDDANSFKTVAKDNGGGGSSSSSSSSSSVTTAGYKLVTLVDVLGKTIATFDTTKENAKNGVITLKTTSTSDSFIYPINLERLQELGKAYSKGSFVFDTIGVDYTMPFDIANKITGLGDYITKNKLVTKNLELRLTMEKLTGAELEKKQAAYKMQFPIGELVSDFYDISIDLYDENGEKLEFDCNKFDEKISFAIQTSKQGNAILVLNSNNKFEFTQGKNDANNSVVNTNHHSVYVVAKNNVSFTDVQTDAWYHQYVTKAANKALVAGVGNALYQPDKSVTRAEFVQMVVNAISLPDYDKTAPKYADVTGDWYLDSIMKAKAAGLLDKLALVPADANSKKVPGMFFPNQPITREEMAYIIAQVMNYEKILQTEEIITLEGKFKDYSEINPSFDSAIQTVVRLNIMRGMSQTVFAPTSETTRAQAATVLINMLSKFRMLELNEFAIKTSP